jgi:hypothetical protein
MTELLRQAIAQIEKLPPDQQDAIAARFLAELQDEQKWENRFATTTDEQWDQMAAMVRQEIGEGETIPSDQAIAEIRPIASSKQLRPFGLCAGEFTVPNDFDASLPEDLLSAFEGK